MTWTDTTDQSESSWSSTDGGKIIGYPYNIDLVYNVSLTYNTTEIIQSPTWTNNSDPETPWDQGSENGSIWTNTNDVETIWN